jgi:hypothetical protein
MAQYRWVEGWLLSSTQKGCDCHASRILGARRKYSGKFFWRVHRLMQRAVCNGQLKICGPFIFDRTVLHLVIVTKISTDRSIYFKYYRPTYFQLSIEYVGINYCFANFKYAEE